MFALAYLSDPNFHPTNPHYRAATARPSHNLPPIARNYDVAKVRLSTADEFRNPSGSFSAERFEDDGPGYLYRVFSYATCIAEIRVVDRKVTERWITDRKYSVTTSKQTSYVRRYLPAEGATI